MNWDILESYIETLFEMVNTGDINCWDAIKKFRAFKNDMDKTTEIVYKKDKNHDKVLKKALENLSKEYCNLYCKHYCKSKPCIQCENGDFNFVMDNYIQQAKEQVDEQV